MRSISVVGLSATLLTAALAFSAGCRAQVRSVPARAPEAGAAVSKPVLPAPARPADEPLSRMGYTIQVGAFAVIENAIALAKTLTASGLDAFYFPSGAGLFKVRFGNYPSRQAAEDRARSLKAEGRIGDYFIVGPADYAVTRPSLTKPPVDVSPPPNAVLRERLVETAKSFIGVEYAWGGTIDPVGLRLQRPRPGRVSTERAGHAPVGRGPV